jgi:hypothetical protein
MMIIEAAHLLHVKFQNDTFFTITALFVSFLQRKLVRDQAARAPIQAGKQVSDVEVG